MLPSDPVDLTNCDREPIHVPGYIQPHGCLLACDAAVSIVERHSENACERLGCVGPILGRPLAQAIGAEAAGRIAATLGAMAPDAPPALMFDLAVPSGARFDVTLHRSGGQVVVELEPASAQDGPALDRVRGILARIRDEENIDNLLHLTSRVLRDALRYDRVMVYRFAADGAGQVVSEDKREDLESFLGQWFPASDIPQQARELYRRNIIRVIGDAGGARSAILPEVEPGIEPLDLSHAHLRAVSPIHLEYLRNMGVAASMSISVMIDGTLWGLIACHHYAPRVLPMADRVAAEMFGSFFALRLHALKQKRTLVSATEARRALDRFLSLASKNDDVGGLLRANLKEFGSLIPCNGIGLWLGGEWTGEGTVPPEAMVPGLARFVGTQAEGRIWVSDALSEAWPPGESFADEVSGVLALPLSQLPRDYLFFFRSEMVHTLDWAGRPEKTYETGPLGDRLTPRKSFAIWKETVRGRANPFSDSDREIAEATRSALVDILLRHNEMMADERAMADTRQRMLNEELNHRVKNILAIIQSLVERSKQDGRSLEAYAESLRGRIQALALAHDQVVRGAGGGAFLDLLRAELSPYGGTASRILLHGPALALDARAFSVMALVLHELATNAAKYGALSRPGGELDVRWHMEEGDCVVVWRESGGPKIAEAPRRSGFGTALIERSIPYDLSGESRIVFNEDGLEAHFRISGQHVAAEGDSDGPVDAVAEVDVTISSNTLADARLLLVEDQMLIAMDVELMLNDGGITDIVTSASVADALRKLKDFTPDLAVLDVNLGSGTTSAPVAQELKKRGVPFIFATGYGDRSMIPPDCADVPVLSKPYDRDAIMVALLELRRNRPPVGEG
ncbi:HWE histidine kinase domain-containing protein [Ancylobacter sp. G4_0304]|uniref:HWE histidine kinase domain-containing protein n=1 Tax=Ancylobacter sp. G4_0304 TaxID=3114289 RepID=UPI0039C5F2D3